MTALPTTRPLLALAMGDPAGISPELTARVLADPAVRAAADIVVLGDARVLAAGAAVAGVEPDVEVVSSFTAPRTAPLARPVLIDGGHCDPARIARGVASREGGAFALANYRAALDLAVAGQADRQAGTSQAGTSQVGTSQVDAVCYTPFNKTAMRLADPAYGDDIVFTTAVLGQSGPASEFNVLGTLWNARVTSHVALADVAALITEDAVLTGIRLTDRSLREAGFAAPRIAVAALNPHAGDGGNFGREEIDLIAPAVARARAEQIRVEGPYPSDTVFLRAKNGAFDAVLTMYHDQGQIAMKLMGFDRGVTFLGGFPFPILTPAHGTAYEIAGRGVADPGATRAALLLAAEMARARAT